MVGIEEFKWGLPTPTKPTYQMNPRKLKDKIDNRPWIILEQTLEPGVDHTESHLSSEAGNSMMGPRSRVRTSIES